METDNINFNQINFGRLEPNSLYAVKFSDYWQLSTISNMIQELNKLGKDYGIRFTPLLYDMKFVNGEE